MRGQDLVAPDAAALTEAAVFLIERSFYGLVWLDVDLVVRERRGQLVDFVACDQPVGLAVIALNGLEHEMHALRSGARKRFEMLNVSVVDAEGNGPRLNFYLHWMVASDRFLLIVVRATTQAELEAELENQSRRRVLAEAKTVEQAKQIAKSNTELTRANRELSEFANVISHDLKSPMRGLRYQAEDIERALEKGDAAAARVVLAELKQQTRRVSGMLSDLLSYARIGRHDQAIGLVDTHAMIVAIVASFPRPPTFHIAIEGHWPMMETVAPALDLVVRNLIDNAIKHHDRVDGSVTIVAAPHRNGIEITVNDDGPGIAQEHQGAVFQPFRKLDNDVAAEKQGSGIGLALVRKTVEAAGARLHLDSAPAARRGCVFRLEWPGRIVAGS